VLFGVPACLLAVALLSFVAVNVLGPELCDVLSLLVLLVLALAECVLARCRPSVLVAIVRHLVE
jgi:L-lactate permease